MEDFAAFVSWPSAPLTNRLVHDALNSLAHPPAIIDSLPEDQSTAPSRLLQWATYDALDHDLTFSHDPNSKILSSSYVIRKALIRKHYLSRCIHNYLTKRPESVLSRGVPRTWELELSFADELDELWSDDLYDLSEEIDKDDPSKWWILKPGMADRGMGLRLFHSKEDLEAIFQDFEQDSDSESEDEEAGEQGNRDTAVVTSQLRHFVVQVGDLFAFATCLTQPCYRNTSRSHSSWTPRRCLCTDQPSQTYAICMVTKSAEYLLSTSQRYSSHVQFHLRVYCVASGAIKVFMYDRILALFSAVPYKPPSKQSGGGEVDLAAHLTNTSLQTERGEEGVRLLDELVGCHILSAPQHASRRQQPLPPRAMGVAMDPDTLHAARQQQAERAQGAQYPMLTADDIANLKHQVSEVLAETFKAAVEMSVHFQVCLHATATDYAV